MKKALFGGLIAGISSLYIWGCNNLFNQTPSSCDDHRLVSFMKQYHQGINKALAGRLPLKDFDRDGKNDFYVVGNDGVVVVQLTSKHDDRWYALGAKGAWKR
jgi:hypothetical protein